MSRLQEGQFRGSFIDGSGCGSRIIFPSLVLFCSSIERSESVRVIGGLISGGKGEGSEDADFRAGALRRPRGSLCLLCDINSMVPVSSEMLASLLPTDTCRAAMHACKPCQVNCSLTWNFFGLFVIEDAHAPFFWPLFHEFRLL